MGWGGILLFPVSCSPFPDSQATLQERESLDMVQRLLILALLLSSAACATRKYMMSRPLDNGLKAVYPAPFDKVKRASYDALSELSYTVKDEKWDERGENSWIINSSLGLSGGGAGK